MDIHRCRFVPYPSSPINALAFSHKNPKGKQDARIAIGRANGDLEIWNPYVSVERQTAWMQETVIAGAKDRAIEALLWVNEKDEFYDANRTITGRTRLFSIGYTSTMTEWDLEAKCAKHHASGRHGEIWCFALQPYSKKGPTSESRSILAGTADGTLVLYSIEAESLRFDKVVVKAPKRKAQMVTMTYQNRNRALVGLSTGHVNVYDLQNNGRVVSSMNLGDNTTRTRPRRTIVWDIKCLPNSRADIVTGDSAGYLSIWNGKTYTLLQKIQGHEQDVLSLTINTKGTMIASGGMDRRTVTYRIRGGSGLDGRWEKSFHSRYHKHDVKAIDSYESANKSVFATGGPDGCPIALPFAKAGFKPHRTLPHLPQTMPLASAPKARLVISWWAREIQIWRIRRPVTELFPTAATSKAELQGGFDDNKQLVSRVLIKGDPSITSASISPDGSLLVVATSLEIKMFQLKPKGENIQLSKAELPTSLKGGATMVQISPDGRWVCIVQEGRKVVLAEVSQHKEGKSCIEPRIVRLKRLNRGIPKFIQMGGLGNYNRNITNVAYSPDSKMLATGDIAGFIDTWVLKDATITNGTHQNGAAPSEEEEVSSDSEEEDEAATNGLSSSGSQQWKQNPKASLIPKLPSSPAVISFSPHIPSSSPSPAPTTSTPSSGQQPPQQQSQDNDYTLLIVTTTNHTLLFSPSLGSISEWSRRNPYDHFPHDYKKNTDIAKGAIWHGDRVWIWGISFIFMIDTAHNIPSSTAVALASGKGRKRKRKTREERGKKIVKIGDGDKGGDDADAVEGGEGEEQDEEEVVLPMDPVPKTLFGQNNLVKVTTKGKAWGEVGHHGDSSRIPELATQDDDEEADRNEGGKELVALRTKEWENAMKKLGGGDDREGGGFWCTRKYRPILGAVVLDAPADQTGGKKGGLEVVLVERPVWDVDMPDRYLDDDEWERNYGT